MNECISKFWIFHLKGTSYSGLPPPRPAGSSPAARRNLAFSFWFWLAFSLLGFCPTWQDSFKFPLSTVHQESPHIPKFSEHLMDSHGLEGQISTNSRGWLKLRWVNQNQVRIKKLKLRKASAIEQKKKKSVTELPGDQGIKGKRMRAPLKDVC